jgi:PAS domain S-box-containing protein
MIEAPLPENEEHRLKILTAYNILDTPPEPQFDDLTNLAAQICQTPIALVSLVDDHRQWFKSTVGVTACETPRGWAFCAHALHEPNLLVVHDAAADKRFATNPLVTSDPHIRFYAGAPLGTKEGVVLGTLCVIDQVPRDLSMDQLDALKALARQVVDQLELRRHVQNQAHFIEQQQDALIAKQALNDNQKIWELIVEAAPSGMVMVDRAGKIVLVNQLIQTMFGYSREALIGEPIDLLIPERFRGNHSEQRMNYFAKPEPRSMGSGRDLYGMRKNGTEFPVEIGLNPLEKNGELFVLASVVDITERKEREKSFQLLSERLILATDSARIGIWDWDVVGNVLTWDDHMLQLYGIEQEQFIGAYEAWTNGLHPNDRERAEQEMNEALQGDKPFETEFRIVWPDTSVHVIKAFAQIARDDQGQPIRMIGVNYDITVQTQAKVNLEEQRQLAAFDAEVSRQLGLAVHLQEMLQGITETMVTFLDAAFARIWSVNEIEEVLELQASAGLYTHLDGAHSRVPIGQLKIGRIASEKIPHLTNQVIGDPQVSEQEWAKREGLVAFAGYPLIIGGKVVGVVALFSRHPLSGPLLKMMELVASQLALGMEQKLGQVRSQELATRNTLLLESAGEGIYGLDLEGKTTFVNPAAAKMLGYTSEELIGVPMHATMHHTKPDGSPYPREECPMYAAFCDGTVHHVEDELLWRKDGSSFPVAYKSTPIKDQNGRLAGAVVTFADITERKQGEQAKMEWTQALETSNKELDDFAYIASHDLKEPLRGMHNYARFLLEDFAPALGETGRQQCETILSLTQRMETLINSLLHFSRLGRTELAYRNVDLDRVVDGVLETLQAGIDERQIQIKRPRPMPVSYCDEARVGEIFRNLLTNAMKYNDKPNKWIEIGFQDNILLPGNVSSKGERVFFIRDNGIGILDKHLNSIFRIFKRLHGREKFGGGTGAGLTIAKKVVERHGGHIWGESTPGEGTTFFFTLEPQGDKHVTTHFSAIHSVSG